MSDETKRVEDALEDEATQSPSPLDEGDAPVTDQAKSSPANGAEVETLREEVQKNLDGWQRSRAEFTNYKKRVQKELSEANERAALDTLSKILPIIDDFERAIQNIPDDIADNAWVSSTALIMKKFERLLEEYNILIVDPVGKPFDPHHHEAIGTDDDSDYASGTITVTLQKGYVCGDRVLRPALVRVAS